MTPLLPSQINRDEIVKVFVDDKMFSGWETAEITPAIDSAARAFSLDVSGEVAQTITPESEVVITIHDDTVVTGFVEGIQDQLGNKTHTIKFVGRSKTCDIVDSSAFPQSFQNQTIADIASALCAPFEVDVVTDVPPETIAVFNAAIKGHRVQPGETVYAAIERAARSRFVLITDTADGELLLTRAGATSDDGNLRPLVVGQNILSRTVSLNWAVRFNKYIVHGQSTNEGDTFHAQSGNVEDDGVRRTNRRLALIGGSQQPGITPANRAEWERRTRMGQSITIEVVVQGWRDAQGVIWRPNTMASVWDPFHSWYGQPFLITTVKFSTSSKGTTTTLQLHPRQAYEAPEQTTKRLARGPLGRLKQNAFIADPLNSLPGAIYGSLALGQAIGVASRWLHDKQKDDLK